MVDTVKVKIADMAALQGSGILITVGLGSCVGIALIDGRHKIAGLSHVLLSDSTRFARKMEQDMNPAKFADTAIPFLIGIMEKMGAGRRNIIAKIAGGSQLFNTNTNIMKVGEKNVEMVRKKLQELTIPLIAEDVGGNYGRTMKVDVETGIVSITTVGKEPKFF